jgi:hypothetical protein
MGRSARLGRVREICLGCVEGEAEVRGCGFFACPLWAFRMGRNPFPLSGAQVAQRAKAAEKSPLALSGPLDSPARPGAGRRPDFRGPNGPGAASERPPLDQLRSWAGRNLPLGSVASPDPREMGVEELAALGCTNRSVSRALWLNDRQNEMAYEKRRALGLQAAVPSAWSPGAGVMARRRRGRGKD